MSEWTCLCSKKIYLYKQPVDCIWPVGPSLLIMSTEYPAQALKDNSCYQVVYSNVRGKLDFEGDASKNEMFQGLEIASPYRHH